MSSPGSSTHSSSARYRIVNGFTLLELLTIMAVSTLLIGAAVPAIKGLSGSGNLTSAGLQVEGLVDNARQNAISKGVPTAVVILKSGGIEGAYRALATFELAKGLNDVQEWRQLRPWMTLPTGVVIDNGADSSRFFQPTSAPSPNLPAVTYRGETYQPDVDYASQIFLPSGRLKSPPAPCNLTLARGNYDSGSFRSTDPEGANYFSLFFMASTGETKITRR